MGDDSGSGPTLAALREKLTGYSDQWWARYLDKLRSQDAPEEDEGEGLGAWEVFRGVDPTRQSWAGHEERYILHRTAGGADWAIPMRELYASIVKQIRAVQDDLGYGREATWDVAGRAVARHDEIIWDGADREVSANTPMIALRAVRVPDQFVVVVHPQRGVMVPGLDKALALRGEAGASVGPLDSPQALIAALVAVLADGDKDAFAGLWMEGTSERDLRYSLDQCRKAYEASSGAIAFDRWADPRQSPDVDAECAETKLFLKRSNTDGTTTNRPITLVREAGGWRLKAGMI